MANQDRMAGPPRFSEDEFYLICVPVLEDEDHIDGCTVERCTRCNREVWRAPSSQPYHRAIIICILCFLLDLEAAKAMGRSITLRTLPGADEELQDYFRKLGN